MNLTADWRSFTKWTFLRQREYVLSFLVCSLCVTVLLKVGEIQYLELILAFDFFLLIMLFLLGDMRLHIFRPFLSIGKSYLIFMVLVFILALIALRGNFYSTQYSLFKRPLLVTVSRMAELFLDVFYMLYFASRYREDARLCIFGAKVYYWMGVLGGIYAIITFPINYFYDLNYGVISVSHRFRGFNNEAGSYGTYLVSVILLTVAMYHRGWLTRRQYRYGIALFLFCMAGSQSKGAFFAFATVAVILGLWIRRGWRRWVTVSGLVLLFIILGWIANIPQQIQVYTLASQYYQQYSNLHANDGNFVAGRISGAVLGPRMIAAHPWLGIGWGNYALVRDDPAYRQGTAYSIIPFDAPSLGVIDYIVDLGIPLWLYLTWLSIKPVYLLRRRCADPWLMGLAMMQPVANWFGAHLNITYPWVVVGLALGMGFPLTRVSTTEDEA